MLSMKRRMKLLLTIIPSKYQRQIQGWITGLLDPIDEQSEKKAYDWYPTNSIEEDEIGKTISLKQIHAYLFEGLYPFAGQIRIKTTSKDGFVFANGDFLLQVLKSIDEMPDNAFSEIVDKCIEMNIAHPFMEGNGRSARI